MGAEMWPVHSSLVDHRLVDLEAQRALAPPGIGKEVTSERIMMLKGDYDAQFQLAADEDREKASIRFVPRTLFY
jgi:hypothetical protein